MIDGYIKFDLHVNFEWIMLIQQPKKNGKKHEK